MKIDIIYTAGVPFAYLEYVLNTTYITGDLSVKLDEQDKIFVSKNYRQSSDNPKILITYDQSQLLKVSELSLTKDRLVARDDPGLGKDTVRQLDNEFYREELAGLLDLANVIPPMYYTIKADSWPDCKTLHEFYNLPDEILEECRIQFGFFPEPYGENNPDIPKNVIRKHLTKWFVDIDNHPLWRSLQSVINDEYLHIVPFKDFYNVQKFLEHIETIGNVLKLTKVEKPEVARNLRDMQHFCEDFIRRDKFINLKIIADNTLDNISNRRVVNCNNHTVIQEAYINAKLGGLLDDIEDLRSTREIIRKLP